MKIKSASVFYSPSFFTSDLDKTPARNQMVLEEELYFREKSVQFIFKAGRSINLPYQAIATACFFLHHFYMAFSFSQEHRYNICNACLFLASKVEECRRSLRDIIKAEFFIRKGNKPPPDRNSKIYLKIHENVLDMEKVLLQAIDFSFHVNHPYQFIYPSLRIVFWDKDVDRVFFAHDNSSKLVKRERKWSRILKRMARVMWWFINDSFRSTLSLFYPPQYIALACLELAVRNHNAECDVTTKVNDKFYLEEYWWEIFDEGIKTETFEFLCEEILKVYSTENKPVDVTDLMNSFSTLERDLKAKDKRMINEKLKSLKEEHSKNKNGNSFLKSPKRIAKRPTMTKNDPLCDSNMEKIPFVKNNQRQNLIRNFTQKNYNVHNYFMPRLPPNVIRNSYFPPPYQVRRNPGGYYRMPGPVPLHGNTMNFGNVPNGPPPSHGPNRFHGSRWNGYQYQPQGF